MQLELFNHSTQPVPFQLLQSIQPLQPIQPLSFNQSNQFSDVEDLSGSWFGATNRSARHLFVILQMVQQVGINQSSSTTKTSNLTQSLPHR